MSNEKLDISYNFPTRERRDSTFIHSKAQYSPYKRPHSGYSTDSRFFARNQEDTPQYLVKRILQKKIDLYGNKPEERSKLFDFEAKQFELELEKWNFIYPDKKGTIIHNREYGPRLILPCLPGQELGWWLNQIEFGDRLTEAKIWLAVAYALRDLASKNLYQNDILDPNILIHNQDNECFKAYVIDFGSVSSHDYNVGLVRVCNKAESLTGYSCKDYEKVISNLSTFIASCVLTKGKTNGILNEN